MASKSGPQKDDNNNEQKQTDAEADTNPWRTVEVERNDQRDYQTRESPPPGKAHPSFKRKIIR